MDTPPLRMVPARESRQKRNTQSIFLFGLTHFKKGILEIRQILLLPEGKKARGTDTEGIFSYSYYRRALPCSISK